MHLRWTPAAAADLEQIANYLFEKTPENAERIVRTIYNKASQLTTFPSRGRPGKKAGTRELALPALPYIIVYRATPKFVYIARILHGAQKWP
jgi:toxin ParE1/3/4